MSHSGLAGMPDEITLQILGFLDLPELAKAARLSKSIKQIADEAKAVAICKKYLNHALAVAQELSEAIDRCDQVAPDRKQQAGPYAAKLIVKRVDTIMLRNLRLLFELHERLAALDRYPGCVPLLKKCALASRAVFRIYLLLRKDLKSRGIAIKGFSA